MTTVSQLRSDIQEWMVRDDITTNKANSFIRLAEASIRRDVRTRDMETVTTLSNITQRTSLPTGFIEMRRIYLDVSAQQDLDYLTPEVLHNSVAFLESGTPTAYTIEGTDIVFAPNPSSGIDASMSYYKAYDALDDSNTTNTLLTNAYDLYLFASLYHAAVWAQDNGKRDEYAKLYIRSVSQINKTDQWSRIGGSSLTRNGINTP